MTDDPIKAALLAAACARIALRCGDPAGTTYTLDPDALREEAAAVAAFLRASAPGNAIAPIGNGSTTIEELAAAVERAAQEAGDGA
jgi:hypothetical protein